MGSPISTPPSPDQEVSCIFKRSQLEDLSNLLASIGEYDDILEIISKNLSQLTK